MPLPSSLSWMLSVDAKVQRAGEHLDTFRREADNFLATVRPQAVRKTSGDSTWLVVWLEDPYPPVHLSTVMGDCLFNLRSALDHLVCALIRARIPNHPCDRSEFPIFIEMEKFEKRVGFQKLGTPRG
jgi:hypothetical protein